MAKIVWDETGKRFYETGVNHGVLYVQNSDGSYKKGVAWNGLTGVTESPEGAEATDLWADNIKYATLRSTETFGGTIEAYTYPEEFTECDGSWSPVTGVYVGQQTRAPFGFCYRTEVGSDVVTDPSGDDMYKLHIVYNATASPSEKSYETINDSPDAITFSWEFTTTPVEVSGKKPTSLIVIDKSKLPKPEEDNNTAYGNLAALESILYGTGTGDSGTNPTLPDPATVMSTMGYTATTA